MKDIKKKVTQYQAKVKKLEDKRRKIKLRLYKFKIHIQYQAEQIKDVKKQVNSRKEYLEAKIKEMRDLSEIYTDLEKEKNDLEEIDEKIRSLNSGNIFTENGNISVQENLNQYILELQDQHLENLKCEIRINGLKKKLTEKLTGIEEAQTVYDEQMVLLTSKEKEYQKVNDEYLKATEEFKYHNSLMSRHENLLRKIRELSSSIELFELNYPEIFFRFTNPLPSFDCRLVYGPVCRLFKLIDFKFELALTKLAGSKLYFIVVEDYTVCQDILETNYFHNRINFIPLNVPINSNSLTPNVIRIAKQIGGANKVFSAMSLIKYDKKYLNVLQLVFGHAFVCTTKEVAEKVCFDNRVQRHCFTLEGDHFDPSGGVAGEESIQRLVLKAISDHDEIKLQLQGKQSELIQINSILNTMETLPNKVAQLGDKQFFIRESFNRIKFDVHFGQPYQQVTEVKNIKIQIVELENKLTEGKTNEKQLKLKVIDLQNIMKDCKNILLQQLNEAKQTRENIWNKIKKNKPDFDEIKDKHNKLELEIKVLQSEVQDEENQLAEAYAEKSRLEDRSMVIKTEFDDVNDIYKKTIKDLSREKRKLLK